MPNRNLSPDELAKARGLLASVRQGLLDLAGDDKELLFALRRKLYKELSYDERDRPSVRRKLKIFKRQEQGGLCAVCQQPLPASYCILDRRVASLGHTAENTQLICQHCDTEVQRSRGYA